MSVQTRILQALAQAIGTPYYCYDAKDVRARFRKVQGTLPSGISYLYSLKANPNKAVVEILHAEGAGCEVCSGTELEIALAAGVRVPLDQYRFGNTSDIVPLRLSAHIDQFCRWKLLHQSVCFTWQQCS